MRTARVRHVVVHDTHAEPYLGVDDPGPRYIEELVEEYESALTDMWLRATGRLTENQTATVTYFYEGER